MRTLLEIVSQFTQRQGLGAVTAVAASTDATIQQIHGLINEGNIEMCDWFDWACLRRKITFSLNFSNNEYLKIGDEEAPGCDIKYVVPKTLWDTTVNLRVPGPATDAAWAEYSQMDSWPDPGIYMVRGKGLWVGRTGSDSRDYRVDVGLLFGVEDSGGALKEYADADDDVFLMPSRLILSDLKWRWLRAKGLPYAEEMRSWQNMVSDAITREGNAGKVDMGEPPPEPGPKIVIPGMSWNLP